MRAPLRCDHCGARLVGVHVGRERKRFCCSECLRAFFQGELRAISPHIHDHASPHMARRPEQGAGRRES